MIRLKNISKFYSKNQTVSLGLRKVNLEFGLNEFVAIVGESGSGKTTLLNVISGIDSYEEGEMYINDEETSYYSKEDWENYRKKYIAFIFQSYNLIESYTVLQNVEAALILSGYPKDKIRERAKSIIERVGLTDHLKHKATKLSGGQKQRVVIARAIAKDAPIIVADEPTGNLDTESAKKIIELLAEIAKDKLVIIVTHDFSQVEGQATRRIRVYDGEVVEDKKITKVQAKSLPKLQDKDYKMNFIQTTKMVLRNLWATPKKSALLFIIFAFATFFFAFIYSSFVAAQAGQMGYNSNFRYAPEERIVLNKKDGTPFTHAELTKFKNNSKVSQVVLNDYILDNTQHLYGWNIVNDSGLIFGDIRSVTVLPIDFLPAEYQGINEDEILISFPDYYFQDEPVDLAGRVIETENYSTGERDTLKISQYLSPDTVAKYAAGLDESVVFVGKELWLKIGRIVGYTYYADKTLNLTLTEMGSGIETTKDIEYFNVRMNPLLLDNEININKYMGVTSFASGTGDVSFSTFYKSVKHNNLTVALKDFDLDIIEISENLYTQLFSEDEAYQISIFAKDGIDARNYIEELNKEKANGQFLYQTYHPANAGASDPLEGLLFLIMNFGFFILFGILFVAIFFISYVIIKNIVNSKLNDYAIFRTIGANKATIRSFVYLENLFIAAIAYLVFLTFVLVTTPFINEDSFLYSLKFFNFKILFYFMIFILAFSILLSRRYVSRVYHDTVAETLRREME